MKTKKLLLLTVTLFALKANAQFSGGDGSSSLPYQIATKTDLKTLCDNNTYWAANYYFIQTQNIVFDATDYQSGGDFYYGGDLFSPIGDGMNTFSGNYDGGNHTIDNFQINRVSQSYVGLFGSAGNTTISNVNLTNCDIQGNGYTGALVGQCSFCTISNSHVSGTVNSGFNYTGGLAGFIISTTVSNSSANCDVICPTIAGGLVGDTRSNSVISNSFSAGSVSTDNFAGGLVGEHINSLITNSYSTSSLSVTGDYSGGLVAISDNSIVSNSYSTGSISGVGSNIGGLIGNDWNSASTFTNSFWDTQTSGQATSAGGAGESTANMQDIVTFTSNTWDFVNETINGTNDYWEMPCGGNDYPKLTWQDFNASFAATGTDTRTECKSYTWIDGNNYTTSNNTATFNIVGGAANGCDSLVTLDLTINSVSDITTSTSGITISANNTVATYQWLDCDNNNSLINGETGQSFTAIANGNFAVELTENGCVDTTDCVAITTVGIIENSFGDVLSVYPNPTNGNFSINLGATYENVKIVITDISGKMIESKTMTQSKILNLSIKEPVGIYIVSIQAGNKSAVIRLVKE